MRKYIILGLAGAMVFSVNMVLADKPDLTPKLVTVNPSKGQTVVIIPDRAIKVSPGVFSLGTASDYNGRKVEGYALVHYKEGFGKPAGCNNDGVCQGWESSNCADCAGSGGKSDVSTCYGFLSKGAKWKEVEPYLVDPTNIRGLEETFIRDNLAFDISKWENAALKDILGNEISGIVDGVDLESPDNKNEIYFGDIGQSGAIGVTVVWGIFGGPPAGRKLVEWDQVYDQVDFDWSAAGEVGKMDFENIATHELGHSVGLNDLYEDKCSEQTMYGYANFGEIKKRTLELGDIIGINNLY